MILEDYIIGIENQAAEIISSAEKRSKETLLEFDLKKSKVLEEIKKQTEKGIMELRKRYGERLLVEEKRVEINNKREMKEIEHVGELKSNAMSELILKRMLSE